MRRLGSLPFLLVALMGCGGTFSSASSKEGAGGAGAGTVNGGGRASGGRASQGGRAGMSGSAAGTGDVGSEAGEAGDGHGGADAGTVGRAGTAGGGGVPALAGVGGGAATGGEPTGVGHPSCQAWRDDGVREDGVQTIDPEPARLTPFAVYCENMVGGPPRSFLELPHRDDTGYPGMNASTFTKTADDACPCPDGLTSSFSKVLLHIEDLAILTNDRTFATFLSDPSCHLAEPKCEGEYVTYAQAADCRGAGIATGTAEVDLRGTPFHLGADLVFGGFGSNAVGEVVISEDRKTASVKGGGFCGGWGATELPLEAD